MNIDSLTQLHAILKAHDNICPRQCYLCERYETAILLPHEEKLIASQPELITQFIKHEEGFYYLDMNIECPYFSFRDNKGDCVIYDERPVDCRIFPFFPKFDLQSKSYELLRSEIYCPISTKDLFSLEKDVKRALDIINETASVSWKQTYNELNYQRLRITFPRFPETACHSLIVSP
jgi:Fe-S-cluster containining protein